MIGGMTVANLAGVPLATMLCNLISWRMLFAGVSLFGLLAYIFIRIWMPRLEALPDTGVKGQFRFLRSLAPWLIYAGVFFGQASVYCWLSYIDPFMTEVTGISASSMTWVMMLVGAGMVFGNAMAGKLADKYRTSVVTGALAASMIIVLPALYFCASMKVPTLILTFLATAGLFGITD